MAATSRSLITLLTDFGDRLGYVGQMKGVMLRIQPDLNLIDISHDVEPQAILEAEMILCQSFPYFPKGTVHLAVIDPGVGSERRGVVVSTEHGFFVGPDNGLFGFLERDRIAYEAYKLENPTYRLANPSSTFHGRDYFAPAAAYLAAGVPAADFGPRVETLIRLEEPAVEENGLELSGQVVAVDRFGNLITSISARQVEHMKNDRPGQALSVIIRGENIPLGDTFSDVRPHEMVAYIGSGGRLEVAVNLGHAADALKVRPGSILRLRPA